MDRIQFVVPSHERERDGVRILINGRDLVDVVGGIERPFAEAEGSPSIAGSYSGLPPTSDVCWPARHFLGEPSPVYQYEEKVQVLGCECGEPGCWPLVCRIELRDDRRVIWRDFEQPHRIGKNGQVPWRYNSLGPFEFDVAEYKRALEGLRPAG